MRGLFLLAMFLLGAWIFAPSRPPPPGAAPLVVPDLAPHPANDRTAALGSPQEITRDPDGHFYADVQVNGTRLRMLVDTGATAIVLTQRDAVAAGVGAGPGEFTAVAQTAGGAVHYKPVTLDRVAVGSLSATRVPAAVTETGLSVSLLGQSFLRELKSVRIEDDRMILG